MKLIILLLSILFVFSNKAQSQKYDFGEDTVEWYQPGDIKMVEAQPRYFTKRTSEGDCAWLTNSVAIPYSGLLTQIGILDLSEVKYWYDTTIYFKGIDTINHQCTYQTKSLNNQFISCGVVHDAAGCSWNWLNEDVICTVCLKYFHVSETRWVVQKEQPKDLYQDAIDRLNKLLNKTK